MLTYKFFKVEVRYSSIRICCGVVNAPTRARIGDRNCVISGRLA